MKELHLTNFSLFAYYFLNVLKLLTFIHCVQRMNISSDSDLEDVFSALRHSRISNTDKIFVTLEVEKTSSKVKTKEKRRKEIKKTID